MPFPIQRIQTDRGGEFFAESVQRRLMSECIKFRPIPPRSPHVNGKVERSQLTDLNEFWSHHTSTEDAIDRRIEEWQFDYNWRRPHGSLGGKTPVNRIAEAKSHLSRSRWVAPTTSGKSESDIANGESTRSLPSIIGARLMSWLR